MAHGVDAVHDALVVRGGAVRIELGEARRVDDAVDAPPRRSSSSVASAAAGTRQRTRTQRRSQRLDRMRSPTLAAARAPRGGRDGLGDGVHEVRAHGVAAVDEHVHDDHRSAAAGASHLELARAAAARDEARGPRGWRARGSRRFAGEDAPRPRARRRARRTSWTWLVISGGSISASNPPSGARRAWPRSTPRRRRSAPRRPSGRGSRGR